jgi:IclR family acetate operon transcriptional repressor
LISVEIALDGAPRYQLESVDNVLRLLMLFGDGRPVRVVDASAALGVARSTAHRLLTTLEHRGFVRQDPMTRAYLVGDTLVHFGSSVSWDKRLEEVALPELTALVERVHETAHIAVLRGADAHFILCVESSEIVHTCSHVGTGLPAYATASGRALLAHLDDEQLRKLYTGRDLVAMRKNTVHTWSQLRSALTDVRRRGYATNYSETEFGVNGIGVAIFANDHLYGAIVVTGSSTRFRRQQMEASVLECKRAAERIASRLIVSEGA